MNKILFILKKRSVYSDGEQTNFDSGLYNSARLVSEMLVDNRVESTLVQVVDNNEIDKYCTQYRPDVVIIEAIWVVPSKFEILKKLHPKITWIIRLHSELPFLANEGIAMSWLREYVKYDKVYIGSNSKYLIDALDPLLRTKIIYLPNYYKVNNNIYVNQYKDPKKLNVGIFGAIRPMKNTLTQAVAAINYADKHNKILFLHINSGRVEQNGDNVLKNLRALFNETPHELVEHGWLSRDDFSKLIAKMDICLQVSLTETYNIVAADVINQNVPVVTSNEIPFVSYFSKVSSNKNVDKMIKTIKFNLVFSRLLAKINKFLLRRNSLKAKKVWLKFVSSKCV
jgi:glycosyltransferase involved in cell wall biosynthesis